MRKISAKKNNLDVIRVSLEDEVGKDEAELICRSLLETCISDGVVAFQKLCEGLYEPHGKAPFNAFQRLEQSDELWKAVYGEGYSAYKVGQRLVVTVANIELLIESLNTLATKLLSNRENV